MRSGARPTADDGRVEGRGDELGPHVGGHAPAHDPAAEGVDDRRQIAGARPRRELGDVGDPESVGARRREVPVDEVGEGRRVLVADRRAHEAATMDAREMLGPHEPGDPLARDAVARLGEVGVDPRHAVRPAAAGVGAPDLRSQGGVGEGAGGRAPCAPGVVAARGDTEGGAEDPHRMARLLLLDEAEPGHRVRSVS